MLWIKLCSLKVAYVGLTNGLRLWARNVVLRGPIYVWQISILSSFNSYLISLSPYFYAKSRWERNIFASFDSIMLLLWHICSFRENLRLMRNITFKRNWRKNRSQTKPRESKGKQTWACTTAHKATPPCYRSRRDAQPGAWQCHWPCACARLPMPYGTAVRRYLFAIYCSSFIFFGGFSLVGV